MSDEYTPPTTDEVRTWIGVYPTFDPPSKWRAAFDRWLDATIRQAKAEALREAADEWSDWDALTAPEDWLRNRAEVDARSCNQVPAIDARSITEGGASDGHAR